MIRCIVHKSRELPINMTRPINTDQGIYLDYAATTPAAPSVISAMTKYLGSNDNFGNPASQDHIWGEQARKAVEDARLYVADLLNAEPAEIIWTSGATEANNLAIKGAVEASGKIGTHIVTSEIEHPAVLDTFKYLENHGYKVSYISPDKNGIIQPDAVLKSLRDDTVLVSLMHINNEIGTLTDIEAIGQITRPKNILFHVDATQSLARLKLDVRKTQVDLLSLSGHKIYAPKGIGALFVCKRPKAMIKAQIHGGGHERGLRSGTLATHQIVGLGEAARLITENLEDYQTRTKKLTADALNCISGWPDTLINGDRKNCADGILSVTIKDIDADALRTHLPHIAFSSGSACTSASSKPSHVLTALGLTESQAECTIRLSFGYFLSEIELRRAMMDIGNAIRELHSLSPKQAKAS